MSYQTQYSHRAAKLLEGLDRATRQRVERRLDELEEKPYDPRVSKPLKGLAGMRSSRVGDWRILYTIQENIKTILVVAIRPRGKAYRNL